MYIDIESHDRTKTLWLGSASSLTSYYVYGVRMPRIENAYTCPRAKYSKPYKFSRQIVVGNLHEYACIFGRGESPFAQAAAEESK